MHSMESGQGYSGNSSYRYVEALITDKSKRLKVICPFISPAYAKMLVRQSASKDVFVITSSSRISESAVRIMRRGRRFPYATLSAYFIILSILFYAFRFYAAELVVVPITALVVGLTVAHYVRPRKQRIKVKVAGESFIHEKVYLSDNSAIVGSANLTYAGLHKNIEHIELIHDVNKMRSLEGHFDELWAGIVA